MTKYGEKKILIIEDDPGLSLVYKLLLLRAGYQEVRYTRDGDAGLEMAKSWRPDLVVSDITHPGLDGVSVFEKLFLNPNTLSTRFIVISGSFSFRDSDYMVRMEEAGVSLCRKKPFDLIEIEKMVEVVLAEAEEETRLGL